MVSEGKVSKIIIAYEDRLTRFGFETLRRPFSALGAEIEVINREEKTPRGELIENQIAMVSRFAGKLYGIKSRKYKEVVEAVERLVSC